MQVSVAAVECDVPHVAYHNVLYTNIVLPEMRKEERHLSSGHKDEKKKVRIRQMDARIYFLFF